MLVRGIAAAKAGSKKEATFFLEWVLRTESAPDQHLEAWWWLSQVSDDPAEKRRFLEEVLARNPSDHRARRSLAVLDGRLKSETIVEADRIPERLPVSPGEAEADRFTCTRCGGRLTATRQGSTLQCAYCGWRRDLVHGGQERSPAGREFVVAMAAVQAHRRPQDMPTFRCQACGAPYQLAPETLSLTCAHCGSTYVLERPDLQELIPADALIPFRLTRVEAAQALAADGRDRTKTPLIDSAGSRLVGVYFPLWSFNMTGQVPWSGMRYDENRKTWVRISGSELVLERDYLVPASPRFSTRWQREALVFDLRELRSFEPAFLAGWPAETYQIPMSDAAVTAHAEVFAKIRRQATLGIHERLRDVRFESTAFTIDDFRLLLAPVWTEPRPSSGSTARRIVNGQTGAVGSSPAPKGWLARLFGAANEP